MALHSCKVCNHRGRRDLVTVDLEELSDEEWKQLKEMAKDRNMSVQSLLRHVLHDAVGKISASDQGVDPPF